MDEFSASWPSARAGRLSGAVLTPLGWCLGEILWDEAGRITAIEGDAVQESAIPVGALRILPGFVDLHVHGGGGRDVMEGGDALDVIARMHAAHGTTSMLATTMTAPLEDLHVAFEGIAQTMRQQRPQGARVHGVHLEGPYINEGKLGAQPDFTRPWSPQEMDTLHQMAPIKVITLAPEVPGHMTAIEGLVAQGYRVQMGHTLGTYEQAIDAMRRGAIGFTHLFNAMSPFMHREPGVVGAALAHAEYAELIVDLLHVHPGAIRVALRSIPGAYCVTDSTSASGMPDGTYRLGRHSVTKCLGGVRLADGTLAGSTLTMDQALRNLVGSLGLSWAEASARTSTYAARYAGLEGRGALEVGAWADMVCFDADLQLLEVMTEGERV